MSNIRLPMAAIVAWAACAVWACDRTHMSPHFGEANRAAFHAQVIDPDAGNATKPNPPLDPEEAATIARTLTKSLAPVSAGGSGYRDPVLLVAPPAPASTLPHTAPDPPR